MDVAIRTDSNDTPASWRSAVRADVGRLQKLQRTSSGGVRVPAAIARVGVLTYHRADGSVVREFVPPEELEHNDSLATLRDAPVTIGHPEGGSRMVSSATYRKDAVGHVSGLPRVDGGHVVAELAVQDEDAIRRIDAGELREISAGYRVMIDPTPGVYEGQRYDAVQRRRTYNHAALLPSGSGRAGATVALRVDEKDVDVAWQTHAETVPPQPARPEERNDSMSKIRIDGVDYTAGSPEHAQAQARFNERLVHERDQASTRADQAEAARDQAAQERDEARQQLAQATAPERLDAAIAGRLELIEGARAVLGVEWKHDGKDEAAIVAEVLAKALPKLSLEGKTDAYKRARFDAIVEAARAAEGDGTPKGGPKVSEVTQARGDAFNPPQARGDGGFVSPLFAGHQAPLNLSTRYRREG